ncbi:hypothetical protein N9A28_09425 [Sulfurimonas sp.]|nr:hypothetical protein [Sulfurimonas sp.]
MKTKLITLTTSTLLIFTACSQVDGANPSQNKAVNAVAGKKEKTDGFMQRSLDKWLKEEWDPVVSSATKPNGETKVKIVPNEDGSSKLVESDTGIVLKEMTKEETQIHKEIKEPKIKIVEKVDGSADVIEVKTGVIIKEMTKEQVENRKEVQEKYSDEDRSFTLQEYVDKMSVYNSANVTNDKDSHTRKINSMPVIGK